MFEIANFAYSFFSESVITAIMQEPGEARSLKEQPEQFSLFRAFVAAEVPAYSREQA